MQKLIKHLFQLLFIVCIGQISLLQAADLPDFSKLVEQVSPAVVNISTSKKVANNYNRLAPDMEDIPPMFREFFREQTPNYPQYQQTRSLGSGFIISNDGYILTNNHVVNGADEIIVRLSDRRELKATLVGADSRTDVALLKVEANNLPVVKMGKSEALKVGEWVMAIGSPFGFDHSVTVGVVSAKGRSLGTESNYVPFIQTDVAINPGNSGGPLFNLNGEVVGINSQIFTRSGGFMGLSFAIPVDVAINVADQLKTSGKVQRAWLGVIIQEVSRDLAESFGLAKPAGALVVDVLPDGPAAKSGLQVGDVVLSVNDQAINRSADLPHIVGMLNAGQKANLQVVREGSHKNISIVTETLPDDKNVVSTGRVESNNGKANLMGLVVDDLTAEQKQRLAVEQGVIIRTVQRGGLAQQMGLRTNDVITHLNNQPVKSANEFKQLIDKLPKDKTSAMRILRNGFSTYITFKLAE
ncbi:DegQ family serine endoprotease [Entomomonas asaccharolytica]|uniref:Probable periplasmic serine endoprotease DegP-like n=1 Tax=Entomomonas asaccharolytica TaxID=2785331 RepID=A0A974RW77_9GAMM|nr:DegQ family serine endoprotease [Entomomonas asaccharolytica]QQP84890.1 DegQ family serine endoprotease [Entomomonas asaccharolytica]